MGPWTQITGRDGRYRFPGVLAGNEFIIMVENPNCVDFQSVQMRSLSSAETSVPPLRMQAGRILSGQLVDHSGRAVSNADVSVENVTRVRGLMDKTDAQGRFRISRIPLGKQLIRFVVSRHTWLSLPKANRPYEKKAQTGRNFAWLSLPEANNPDATYIISR
jgi:hypothetical protein